MNIDKLVERYYDQLSETDVYIWQYIYHNREKCRTLSVLELATACNVSKTNVIRFAQKLGLDGYSELKIYIKLSLEHPPAFDTNAMFNTASEIYKTVNHLEKMYMTDIVSQMYRSRRVFIYVTGEVQTLTAMELKRKFVYINQMIHIIEDETAMNVLLSTLTNEDMMMIISFEGDNPNAVQWAKTMRSQGVCVLGIAKDTHNLLRRNSDFFIGFTASKFSTGVTHTPFTCTSHFFVITDVLIVRFLEYVNSLQL